MTSTPLLEIWGRHDYGVMWSSVPGQWPSGVFQYVVVEHMSRDFGKISRDVLVHARVFSQIVEPGLRPVVAAHHGVLLVPGEDVVMVSEREMGSRLGLSAFQHHGEILAIQRLRRFDPDKTQDRRRDVVGRSVILTRRPRSLTVRMADKERDVRNLRPESGGELTDDAVFPVGDAVVGEEYEEGVVEEIQLFHLVQKAAEPAVRHRHLAR